MEPADKRYKFINSETGYVIYYHTLRKECTNKQLREELEKVQAQVAIKNHIFVGTVYWEEIKEEKPV